MSYTPCEVPRSPARSRPMAMSLRQKRVISLAQFVLVIANTISLIPGLTFLGIGVMFLLLRETILPLLPFTVNLFVAPLVAMGFLAYAVTVLGYCSVWKHWRSLLVMPEGQKNKTARKRESFCFQQFPTALTMADTMAVQVSVYAVGTVALMVTQGYLAAATASWGQMRNVQNLTESWLTSRFANNETRRSFELIEAVVPCCGSYGAKSYTDLKLQVPASCCKDGTSNGTCVGGTLPGCARLVSTQLQTATDVIDGTFFYLIAIELIAVMASVFLYRNAPVNVAEPLYYTVRNAPRDQPETDELVTFQPQRRPSI